MRLSRTIARLAPAVFAFRASRIIWERMRGLRSMAAITLGMLMLRFRSVISSMEKRISSSAASLTARRGEKGDGFP